MLNSISKLLLFAIFLTIWGKCDASIDRSIDSLLYYSSPLPISAKDELSTYINLSKYYQKQSYSISLFYLRKAIRISQKGKKNGLRAQLYLKEALLHQLMGNYPKGLESAFKTLHYAESISDLRLKMKTYKRIGSIYHYAGEYDNAWKYFIKERNLANLTMDSIGLASAFVNLGHICRLTNRFEKSIQLYFQAFNIYEKRQNPIRHALYGDLGKAYYGIGKYNKSLKFNLMFLAETNSKPMVNKNTLSGVYVNLGKDYNKLKLLSKSIEVGLQGVIYAKELGNKEHLKEHYINLSNAEMQLGNVRKAFEYQQLYLEVKDELLRSETLRKIAGLEIKYENEKQQQKILDLKRQSHIQLLETNQQKQYKVTLIGASLLIILIAVLIIRLNKLSFRQKNAVLKERLLRSQMNPHFVFNSLMSMQCYIQENNIADAEFYLVKIARFIRNTLDNSKHEYIAIEKEISTLKYYLELQHLRFSDRFDYRFITGPNFEMENLKIPSMLLQFYLEHLIEKVIFQLHEKSKGKLSIYLSQVNNDIVIECKSEIIYEPSVEKSFNYYQPMSTVISTTNSRVRLLNRDRKNKRKLIFNADTPMNTEQKSSFKISFVVPAYQ